MNCLIVTEIITSFDTVTSLYITMTATGYTTTLFKSAMTAQLSTMATTATDAMATMVAKATVTMTTELTSSAISTVPTSSENNTTAVIV